MALKIMLNGYTGRCTVDGYATMMTSYNFSVSTNVIKSTASVPLWRNKRFDRIAGLAVRDYPTYNLSISIEVTEAFLWHLFEKMGKNGCRDAFKVNFIDDAYGVEYGFRECYLQRMDFAVDNEAAATVQLEFAYFKDTFTLKYGTHDLQKKNNADRSLVGAVLLGYYSFGIRYSGFEKNDLYQFSFSYRQPVTPKFGCVGKTDRNAVDPMKAIFGQPEMTYSLTYIMATQTSIDHYRIDSNKVANQGETLAITRGHKDRLVFTNCYPDSYDPQVGQKNGANMVSIEGTVYGSITYGK